MGGGSVCGVCAPTGGGLGDGGWWWRPVVVDVAQSRRPVDSPPPPGLTMGAITSIPLCSRFSSDLVECVI